MSGGCSVFRSVVKGPGNTRMMTRFGSKSGISRKRPGDGGRTYGEVWGGMGRYGEIWGDVGGAPGPTAQSKRCLLADVSCWCRRPTLGGPAEQEVPIVASGGRLGEPKALSPEASSLTARLPDQRMAHSEGGGRSHAAELDGGAVA